MKKRSIALLLACVLILGVAIGGTVAWIVDVTDEVENVFVIGDINISLWENQYDNATSQLTNTKVAAGETNTYNFVPGDTLPKNPTVTVAKGSEACYLFVKVTAEGNSVNGKNVLNYTVDTTTWTAVPDQTGVYYKTQDAIASTGADASYTILANDQVTVNGNIEKTDVSALQTANPRLIFQAAAVQSDNIEGADEAAKVATAYGKVNWN